MSVVQVFSSFVMLSLACVFVRDDLSSVEMWFDRGENWCYGLSKDGRVETVAFRQVMWLIMLKSDKDRIYLRSRPSEQHVSPRVRYGTACLLIRYVVGCVSCSVEWGWLPSLWSVFMTCFLWTAWTTWCKRDRFVRETSVLQAVTICQETVAKHDIFM
jgi:hypothetical protein